GHGRQRDGRQADTAVSRAAGVLRRLSVVSVPLDADRVAQAGSRVARHRAKPVSARQRHLHPLPLSVRRDRYPSLRFEYRRRHGRRHGAFADVQRADRVRARPVALQGRLPARRHYLPRLSGAADRAVHPVGPGGRPLQPLQLVLGLDLHLPDVPHPLRLLAADGLLPDHLARVGRRRAGRRRQPMAGDVADHPAARDPRDPLGRHLLFHPRLERVPLRPRLHGRRRHEDDPGRRSQRSDPGRCLPVGIVDGRRHPRLGPRGDRLFVLRRSIHLGLDRRLDQRL
ncbi:MAG: ABC transporter, permease protein 2 (cluster 1, maltose/g3p/polyamine/iron), partial [uncultured Thermomicrobiales bacterium]